MMSKIFKCAAVLAALATPVGAYAASSGASAPGAVRGPAPTNGVGAVGVAPLPMPTAPGGATSGIAPQAPSASSVPPIPGGPPAPSTLDNETTAPNVVTPGQKGS